MATNFQSNASEGLAVVTGANRGLGKELVTTFAELGKNVAACSRNITDDFVLFCENLSQEYKTKVFPIQLDLSDSSSIKLAIQCIRKLGFTVEILVNNAATAFGERVLLTKELHLRQSFEVNFFGPFIFTQGISRLMSMHGSGSIVFISSSSADFPMPGMAAYGSSKAAINYLTKILAIELASSNIRVNAIAPNIMTTDMYQQMDQGSRETVIARTGMSRPGEPYEVANAVVFLTTEKSSYITGTILHVDGGRV